jgi:SAM-dependent methyltransferase
MDSGIVRDVAAYYAGKLAAHGASPKGVDWNSAESQRLRFDVLRSALDEVSAASVLDFGCGYGALLAELEGDERCAFYVGYDAEPSMIDSCLALPTGRVSARFTSDLASIPPCDVAIASGVLNVRAGRDEAEWGPYVLHIVDSLSALSTRAFAFNALTAYSDPEKMRADLHYADPIELFDYCKRRHGRRVALLHDYPLYEFTIIVRKDP